MSGNENITRTVEWTISPEWDDRDCDICGGLPESLEVSITNGRSIDARAAWGCYSEDATYNADMAELHLFLDRLPVGFISDTTKAVLLAEVDKELADK